MIRCEKCKNNYPEAVYTYDIKQEKRVTILYCANCRILYREEYKKAVGALWKEKNREKVESYEEKRKRQFKAFKEYRNKNAR